ncbi:MAG TPA: hypothetical protein VJK54_05545, partial [Chthoniobacterales bacterium]|nr:hypothetical protein [Chthoniobacterales bacterium]
LNCHLMMNPAMVEESEEAIEQFILGKTQLARKYSVKPSETCDRESTDQQNDLSNIDQHINQPIAYSLQPTASIRPAGRIVTINPSVECAPTNHQSYSNCVYNNAELQSSNSSLLSPTEAAVSPASISVKADTTSEENIGTFSKLTGYFSKAAKPLTTTADSLYLCPPEAADDLAASELNDSQQLELKDEATEEIELPSQELKASTKTSTSADHFHKSSASYITRAAKALISYLACSSLLPQVLAARDPAFVVYSTGNSTDQMYPLSLTANTDGSYIMGGLVFLNNATNFLGYNSLLGKFDTNGQKEWFYKQSTPNFNFKVMSTIIMNNELFSGGYLFVSGTSTKHGYISRNNLTSGTLLSAWNTGLSTIIDNILPTSRNTLISNKGDALFEFDPYNGVVLSAARFTDGCAYNGIAAIDDHSYIIGGATGTKACLSKISLTGTTWSSAWTRFYSVPSANNVYINSVAVRNNTAIFAGHLNNDATAAFIGSIDATTGATHWVTSIRGTSVNSVASGDSLNTVVFANGNTNQIMAVGGSSYLLMNLNDGTLSKSVTLQRADILSVVANNDGTFTSLGMGFYCDDYHLLFVTLNKNLEIDPSLLPPGAIFNDNSHNIVLGAQNIISTASSSTVSPLSPSSLQVTDITSRFSVVNNSITQTCPPNSDSDDGSDSSYIIAGGSAGAAVLTSALMCAFRKRLAAYCSKKYSSLSSVPQRKISRDY